MYSTRRSGIGLIVALSLALVAALPVSAAPKDSSRSIFFGTTVDRTLDVSPNLVYPGGYVAFTATVKNLGNQTLTHATFGLGDLAAARPGVAKTSLPEAWRILSVTPSVGTCTLSGTANASTGVMCDLGSLAGKRGQASVDVVLHAAAASTNGVWASLKVAEQVNDNGANGDTFFSDSDDTTAESFDTPSVSTLTCNHSPLHEFFNRACTATQSSKANMRAAGFTSGELTQTADGPNCRPGGGAECFGVFTTVDIPEVQGAAVVEWTVTWNAATLSKNFKLDRLGVIHFPDSGPAVKILASNACDEGEVNCTLSFGFINGGAQVEMVFRTPENGAAKGFG